MEDFEELQKISEELEACSAYAYANDINFTKPINALLEAAQEVGRASSGSWLGYHARIYYRDFSPPPAVAHFSQRGQPYGPYSVTGSMGQWVEYDSETVIKIIWKKAGHPDLTHPKELSKKAASIFHDSLHNIKSILTIGLGDNSKTDEVLSCLLEKTRNLHIQSAQDIIKKMQPEGRMITRDTRALRQGICIPEHIKIQAEIYALQSPLTVCKKAGDIARQAASHMERLSKKQQKSKHIGNHVFIGHGRSEMWHDLKDFIQDRLKLLYEEFNRVPVAGKTNIERLEEMLDNAAIALLIMTAEDETVDGVVQARMNVIHEVGLFQGRLGFTRAVVLLEEGCEEFSNIQGLGQIRFPKNNIKSAFEDIRALLEREGLLES